MNLDWLPCWWDSSPYSAVVTNIFGTLTDKITPKCCHSVIRTDRPGIIDDVADGCAWCNHDLHCGICHSGCVWEAGWPIAPTATASFFGTCDYPRNYGVVFLAYGIGAIVGPQLAAAIKEMSGSYVGVFPYVALLAALGIVIAFTMLKHPKSSRVADLTHLESINPMQGIAAASFLHPPCHDLFPNNRKRKFS